MIYLAIDSLTLTIDSDRIVTFDSPSELTTGVTYSTVGVPVVRGVEHETKFLWQGIQTLLTQSQLNDLTLLKHRADSKRRSQNAFAVTFYNTVFPFTEDEVTREIAPDTETEENDDSVTYFPVYNVLIENITASILGELRQVSFDLIELEKTIPEEI